MKNFKVRVRGLTMMELLVASTISAIVLTGLFVSLGNVYFSQKKLNAMQSFASESRFLMERVTQLVRNNTIDYDRYFIEIGPDTGCVTFDINQVPLSFRDGESDPDDLLEPIGNTSPIREILGYSNIFYWNIAGEGERVRNLGGKKPDTGGDDVQDPCARAWHGTPSILYLINRERTEQTALQVVDSRLQMQRLLGVDTTGDGKAEDWAIATKWEDGYCKAYRDLIQTDLMGAALGALDDKKCARAHDWTTMSPAPIEVLDFEFVPSPDRDPYLNYRVDEAQIHPHVFLRLHTKLRNPAEFGVRSSKQMELIQQTTASSRVFGDPR